MDFACGNGVEWFVDKGNFTLMSGALTYDNQSATILQQNLPVSKGTELYFIVSPKDNNNGCDTTYLEVDIECKGKCTDNDDSLLVDLVSFNVIPLSDDRVLLEWETSSEQETVGFNIWRSQLEDDNLTDLTKVNEQFIPSRSLAWNGTSYQVVMMDNATFHNFLDPHRLTTEKPCQVWDLPPDSPDLNPIEHTWVVLKRYVRRYRSQFESLALTIDFIFHSIPPFAGT